MGETQLSYTEIELYLTGGCLAPESYAQTAHDQTLLFTFSRPNLFSRDRLLLDAHSAPLLHSKNQIFGLKRHVDVYKGDASNSLVFTVERASVFSRNLHIFLVGSSLDGSPDYKLEPATFSRSLKIFRGEHVVAKAKAGLVFCGCGPSYIISTSSGIDQAMAVLLVAIYDDFRPTE